MSEKVNVIYKGAGKQNFVCEGKNAQRNISNGDIITDIPKNVYERDMKKDPKFMLVGEKKEKNKMEKSTKGSE